MHGASGFVGEQAERGVRVTLGRNGYDLELDPPARRLRPEVFRLVVHHQAELRRELRAREAA